MSHKKHPFSLSLAAALCWTLLPTGVAADAPLPVLGTDASTVQQYEGTVRDAGRPLTWNLQFMDDHHHLNTSLMSALVDTQHQVHTLVITIQIQASLSAVLHGERDGNLKRIAQQLADWHHAHPDTVLIVRPFHEMNGDWYPWGFKNGHNGNSAAQFIPAWQHVRSLMRGVLPSLSFMWCPNVLMGKNEDFTAYYPGADQLEYLGLDGYNHSTSMGGWKTMQTVFERSLPAIRQVDANTPLVIAETATTEPDAPSAAQGHSKAQWFANTPGNMGWWLHHVAPAFGVRTVLYFNYSKQMQNKPTDYLIYDPALASAEASRTTFRQSVADLP